MGFKIKTEAEYQELLAKINQKKPGTDFSLDPELTAQPAKKRSRRKTDKASANILADLAVAEISSTQKPKKRQGLAETPIMMSLRSCEISVECSATHATLLFKGARLFTLNEIYAILQYRSYIVFAYKKQWHSLVQNGLRMMGRDKPYFDGPCKITLFRQGRKSVDRDSFSVMFKYIIDALKNDSKAPIAGIFPDDNPDIFFDDEKIQTLGTPMVGIRVDLIVPTPTIPSKTAESLFDAPPVSLRCSAVQPDSISLNKSNALHTPAALGLKLAGEPTPSIAIIPASQVRQTIDKKKRSKLRAVSFMGSPKAEK